MSLHACLAALIATVLSYTAPSPAPLDPQIGAMVAQVRAERLRATDTKLVGFFTRNDFSETSSTATHGVFGARDWIRAQFEEIAKTSGGSMTIALCDYLQPKPDRTPRAVTATGTI